MSMLPEGLWNLEYVQCTHNITVVYHSCKNYKKVYMIEYHNHIITLVNRVLDQFLFDPFYFLTPLG